MKSKQNEKKKKSTSKKKLGRPVGTKGNGRPPGYKLKIIEKRFQPEYPGQDPKFDFLPPTQPDLEKVLPEPEDEASKHKFPPKKKNPVFREKWMEYIDNVSSRTNFKIGHLNSLTILCDLYAEYDELEEFIRTHGRAYLSVGRSGETWKMFPQVDQLTKTRNQIKDYTKILDLVLKKDHSEESDTEEDNWS